MGTETRPVMFITYAYNDPDEAPVLDSSGTIEEARKYCEGRSGFTYRYELQSAGIYGNEQFIEEQKVQP